MKLQRFRVPFIAGTIVLSGTIGRQKQRNARTSLRVIASVKVGGVEYQAIWASLSWIKPDDHKGSPALALTIRSGEGKDEAIIRRNASLADVESSLRQLCGLGFNDSKLSELFNHKGNPGGLAQHVKVLVANMK